MTSSPRPPPRGGQRSNRALQGAAACTAHPSSMHAELKISFLVVTHDPRLAARCDRVIELVDGRIKRDELVAKTAEK